MPLAARRWPAAASSDRRRSRAPRPSWEPPPSYRTELPAAATDARTGATDADHAACCAVKSDKTGEPRDRGATLG